MPKPTSPLTAAMCSPRVSSTKSSRPWPMAGLGQAEQCKHLMACDAIPSPSISAPRSYEIDIGEGLIAEAGAHQCAASQAAGHRHRHRQQCRSASSRAAGRSLADGGHRSIAIVLPAGEATKATRRSPNLRRLLAAALSAATCHRLGRRRHWRSRRLCRGDPEARRRFHPDSDDAARPSRFLLGGKTGINSALGKNHWRVSPAAKGAGRHRPSRHAAAPRTGRGLRRSREIRPSRRSSFFAWLEANAEILLRGDAQARVHAIHRSCRAKASIVAEDETKQASAPSSISVTLSAMRSKRRPATATACSMAKPLRLAWPRPFAFRSAWVCANRAPHRVDAHRKSVGLPTRINDIPGPLPPWRTPRDHAPGQEGAGRQAHLYPGARYWRSLHCQKYSQFGGGPVSSGGREQKMSFDLGLPAVAIVFLLLLSAFFSGSETALTATSRAHLTELERRGSWRASVALSLTKSRERLPRDTAARQQCRQYLGLGPGHGRSRQGLRRQRSDHCLGGHDGSRADLRRGHAQDLRHCLPRPGGAGGRANCARASWRCLARL